MSDRFYQMLFAFFVTGVTFAVMGAAYSHPPHSESMFLMLGLLLVTSMMGLLSGAITAGYAGYVFACAMLLVLLITGVNNYAMTHGSFSLALAELVLGYGIGFLLGRTVVIRMRPKTALRPS